MNTLYLHQLAQRLENYTIDNGPMGESRPFAEEARKLRQFASEVELATIDNPGPRHFHTSAGGDMSARFDSWQR
jgi:hypothetical protein